MFRGNRIYKIDKKGNKKRVLFVPGIHISFKGRNSEVMIFEPLSNIFASRIVCGNNCRVIIKSSSNRIKKLKILASGDNSEVLIGENFSLTNGCEIVAAVESDLNVKIGDDCMFAKNILIRATDGHCVADKYSGEILNYGKSIEIGNHVWLANNVMILKGGSICANSVVSAGSIITKPCSSENSVYAGIPAKRVKTDIVWDRKFP